MSNEDKLTLSFPINESELSIYYGLLKGRKITLTPMGVPKELSKPVNHVQPSKIETKKVEYVFKTDPEVKKLSSEINFQGPRRATEARLPSKKPSGQVVMHTIRENGGVASTKQIARAFKLANFSPKTHIGVLSKMTLHEKILDRFFGIDGTYYRIKATA